MKAIARRLHRLEDTFGPAEGTPPLALIVCQAGWSMALEHDRLMEILAQSGFLPAGPHVLLHMGIVPMGLNAEQAERFVREHAAEICGFRGVDRVRIASEVFDLKPTSERFQDFVESRLCRASQNC
jgi:hypothetical protein